MDTVCWQEFESPRTEKNFPNKALLATATSRQIDFGLDPAAGLGNANLTPEGSEVRYDSSFNPSTTGGAATDAPYVLYEGRFDASNLDNLSDISDVGTGRVSVTCP